MYRFSQHLAWVAGIVLPAGETLRRWGSWWDYPPAILDDLLSANMMTIERPDPAGVSGAVAVGVKAIMVLIGLAGLAGALRGPAFSDR